MVVKFYLDTSIWLDLYEKRGIHGEYAFQLLQKILLEDHIIIVSDVIVKEFKRLDYNYDQIEALFSSVKSDNIQRIHIVKKQLEEAKSIARKRNIPQGDALHAILARDHEAILISRDKDFQKVRDIVKIALPEDLM